ncbi:MAG: hypothetical protein EXS64_19010 [Candidatus Latescibacteria bacterium]|nr:hypothetical protein [Candidatus Latescibacterota bacterium]
MSRLVDYGRYIDLISMDKYFHNIAIALHVRESDDGHLFTLHTYSRVPGAEDRVKGVAAFMVALGGMEPVAGAPGAVRFPCGELHERGIKRMFNEVVMLDPATPLTPKPLSVQEAKAGRTITVDCEQVTDGGWTYLVNAQGSPEGLARRVATITGGLLKLGDMQPVAGTEDRARFSCGHDHRALVGLLLPRALNVRAVIAAEEAEQKRGVLLAPSAQETPSV